MHESAHFFSSPTTLTMPSISTVCIDPANYWAHHWSIAQQVGEVRLGIGEWWRSRSPTGRRPQKLVRFFLS
ncbi:MAG: hypothetical protein ABW185_25380 [Sedimenticola sp.]